MRVGSSVHATAGMNFTDFGGNLDARRAVSRMEVESAMTEVTFSDIVRPFLWVATVSFAAGFAGYIVLAPRLAGN